MSRLFSNSSLGVFMKNQPSKLNTDAIWVKIVGSDEVKDFIVHLNTEEQLFEKGIDSTGETLTNSLGRTAYTPLTVKIKQSKSGKASKVSNITLYDTGEYYESHAVKVTSKGFTITSNPNKGDTNLYNEWGSEIVGLTEESLQKLIDLLLERYIKYTRNVIFAR